MKDFEMLPRRSESVLHDLSRRSFLAAGAAAVPPRLSAANPMTLGVIGSGSRGTFVMTVFQKDPAVRVNAICDVYEPNLERALSTAAKTQGNSPRAIRNYKQILEDKSIRAVLIATPEHWHHRMVLDALAAGKDVYVEKPLCQTPEQGVELVEAERRSKQIIQVGMQRRSFDLYLEGRKIVVAGELGAVRMVRSWWLNNYLGVTPVTKLDGPLDWNQWLGPAAPRPLDPDRFRNWRFYSDYAGGIVADQGAHVFDGIHMLMGAGYPLAVTAAAGRPHKPGVDTPESVVVTAEYPEDFIGVFSINYAAMRYQSRNDQINQLDGDAARMDIGRESLAVYRRGAEETAAITRKSERGFGYATDLHVQNFLECVRTRAKPTAPMALGFQAALVVQMANLSLKHGRRIRWNASARRVEI
jgi:predicted dehydrogenase